MTPNSSRRRRTPAERIEAAQRFHDSGLSAVAFCGQEGISTPTLTRWRAEAAAVEAGPAALAGFVEVVRAAPTNSATLGALLTIKTPEGAQVLISDRALAVAAIHASFTVPLA